MRIHYLAYVFIIPQKATISENPLARLICVLDIVSKSTYNTVHMEIDSIPSVYVTRSNLQIILGKNRRTLDYRISALMKKKVLERLKNGFYLNIAYFNKSQSQQQQLLEYIGGTMVYPSYVSLEYILEKNGFLAESVYAVTYITTKKTRRIATKRGNFIYRSIKEDLFFGFTAQTVDNAEYFVASLAKALFDFLYLTPWKTKQQMETFLKESRFNWKVLREKDKLEFKQIISQVKIKKMNTACQFLKEERMI
ncbi:MAG: hypothetical protein UV17_C0037G0002 [Candidatus Gottesmanbacteria bacterium GW2011_GWA1_42_26]|nr:MAG: hypothetical protein UV17_C0037G0002 [Candidatus Gottesmanbacteria bacterium GW2011_GWA1_42_26]